MLLNQVRLNQTLWTIISLVILKATFIEEGLAQPANDNCITSQPVNIPGGGGTICINSSSLNATSSNTTNTCNGGVVNEVWFSYIAAGPSNTITITPNGGSPIQQPVITISDAACGSTTYNTCDAATTANGTASTSWAYGTGTQVIISVAGIMGDGDFEICITSETPPPTPGSSCGGATPTCDASSFTIASTAGNPSSGISPSCFNIAGVPQLVQNDLWFVFSVGQTGTLEFTATMNGAAEFDWAVFDITSGCPGTEVSCNYSYSGGNSGSLGLGNPAGGEFNAPITVNAGNTYAIMIDNYDNNGVGFDFDWGGTFQMAPTADFTISSPNACNTLTTDFVNNTVGATTYDWNFGNGNTSNAQNPSQQTYNTPGTYFVTLNATSAAGCTSSYSGSVEVFPEPNLNFSVTDESCSGACDGELIVSASGTGPFTYAWVGGSSSATNSNLCAGNYDITVTDQSNGCSGTGTGTVASGNATADATINPIAPFCVGDSPINLTAATGGGTWSGTGITDQNLGTFDPSTAGAGNWTITYTIAGGCGGSDTETISVTGNLDATITPAGPFCISDASVTLSAVDASGTWSGNGITDATAGTFDPGVAGLGTSTITYTISGSCGDVQTTDILVEEVTFAQAITAVDCNGNSSGEILIQNPSGTPPHLFSIDGGNTYQASSLFQNLSATNYVLVVEDASGCSSQPVNVTIAEPNPIVLNALMNQESNCGNPDGQASVTANGGTILNDYQYSWDTSPIQNTSTATNLLPGSYQVTVTDDNGCIETASVNVTQTPGFTASITNSTDATCYQSCDGNATVLADNNATAPVTYLWNDTQGQTSATATGLCVGNYSVTVTDDLGCIATASIEIVEPDELIVDITSTNSSICIGESAGLTAQVTGGTQPYTSFDWTSNPTDASLTSIQNPQIEPIENTQYTLTVTDTSGCISGPAAIEIEVLPSLTLDVVQPFSGSDTSICLNSIATIDLSASGGDGNYNYFLLPDQNNAISLPYSVSPSSTTTYEFMVTDGCTTPSATASSVVTVYPSPIVTFSGFELSGCHPHSVTFTDETTPTPINWEWNFGDTAASITTSDLQNPVFGFSGPGLYDVSLTVTSSNGCKETHTETDFIEVFELPIAAFDLDPYSSTALDSRITFTDQSSGEIETWLWEFGDGDTSDEQHPQHTYLDTGTFSVSLHVFTENGCEYSARDKLYVNPIRTLYVPNAFTPNQDDINEGFRAYGEGYDWSTYKMTVYNRWGQEIFTTNDIEQVWDGKYLGDKVEVGIYTWRILVSDFNGRIYPFNGMVNLFISSP